MGPGEHSAMDRSNYIFHSDNGRKITPIERQKLSLILKSLEEKAPLRIDPEKQVVIFENNEQVEVARQQMGTKTKEERSEKREDSEISRNIEQKDVFQRYIPQTIKKSQPAFSTNLKDEKKPQRSIKDENFFKNVGPKADSVKDNFFNSFASIKDRNNSDQNTSLVGGSISFSSSQKLPVEQEANAAKAEETKNNEQKSDVRSAPPKQFQQHSQWQMRPKNYKSRETELAELSKEAKNTGNIIDLKN